MYVNWFHIFVSALCGHVTCTFHFFDLKIVTWVLLPMHNLWTKFTLAMSFFACSHTRMGRAISWSCRLELQNIRRLRVLPSVSYKLLPSLKYVRTFIRKQWHISWFSIVRLVTLIFDLLTSKLVKELLINGPHSHQFFFAFYVSAFYFWLTGGMQQTDIPTDRQTDRWSAIRNATS